MSPNAERQAGMAEAIGPSPRDPLPSLWKHLTDLLPLRRNTEAVVSRRQNSDPDSRRLVCSYEEMFRKAEDLASQLFKMGVRKGTSIAAFSDNRVEWALMFWASVRLDAVFVPLNPQSINSPHELKHILQISQPGVLVVIDETAVDKVEESAANEAAAIQIRLLLSTKSLSSTPQGWIWLEDLLVPETEISSPPKPLNDGDQPAVIIFTSGTTSLPKPCLLSYNNICASAIAHQGSRHVTEQSISLQHLPSFHAWGITVTLAFWLKGASIIYPSMSFDAGSTLKAIQEESCTHMAAVPSMISALTDHHLLSSISLQSLQSVDLAGSVVHPETIRACMDQDQIGALYASASYGMTEGSVVLAFDQHQLTYDQHSIPDRISVGKPTPRAKVRICEPGTRKILNRDAVGELHIGGAQVTRGYHGISSDAIYEDNGRWIVTGDRATMDESGQVFILGRYKDLIIRGGENISPATIERCLNQYGGITSQVVGIADEIAGELPVAVILKDKDLEISRSRMRERITRDLGQNSKPQCILDLRDDLAQEDFPKTLSGKIKKNVLKDMVEDYLKEADNISQPKQNDSTIDALFKVWAQTTGQHPGELSTTMPLNSIADSITMMRYIQLVKRRLAKSLSIEDIRAHASIEAQAKLLDRRSVIGISSSSHSKHRDGPPEVADMIHAQGDVQVARVTKDKVKCILASIGLVWDDVEDVCPVADLHALQLRRLRNSSWNHRHAYITASADMRELRRAVELCLSVHPILRSMAIYYADMTPLYVIVRANRQWLNTAITENLEVEEPEDLSRILYSDSNADYAAFPGPLFKIFLVHVRSTNTAGIVYIGNHSCFDVLSINLWLQDLDTALHPNTSAPAPHADFKLFAQKSYQSRSTLEVQDACDFHFRRLRDIFSFKEALWPPQRAPEWFKGNWHGWASSQERFALDGTDAVGVSGINVSIKLPSLPTLRSQHGVPAQIVVKAALTLLNIHLTHQTQAIFSQYEAARSWPSSTNDDGRETHQHDQLSDPMDIPGPTFSMVLNRIHVSPDETLKSLLNRLLLEQQDLTRYATAPIRQIQALLATESKAKNPSSNDELFDSIMRRQVFNWLPNPNSQYTHLRRIQVETRSDVGLLWNCFLVDAQTVAVNVTYDDAQLRALEVRKVLDELKEIAEWIAGRADSEVVGSCPLLGRLCGHVRSDEYGEAI